MGLRTRIGWARHPGVRPLKSYQDGAKNRLKRASCRAEWRGIFICTANRVETRTIRRMRRRRLSQKRLADCCWLLFLLQRLNTLRWTEGEMRIMVGVNVVQVTRPRNPKRLYTRTVVYIYIYTFIWNIIYTCNARMICKVSMSKIIYWGKWNFRLLFL